MAKASKLKDKFFSKNGSTGGLLVGDKHSAPSGGIAAVVKKSRQPIVMEGGEVVITAPAVESEEKHEFEGEMLTNRQILSRINVSGGGVAFEDGGEIPSEIASGGKTYRLGGKTMTGRDIIRSCGCKHKMAKGGMTQNIIGNIPVDDDDNTSAVWRKLGGPLEEMYGKPFRTSSLPKELIPFVPVHQVRAISGSEEHWEILENLLKIVQEMPKTYETDGIPADDKIVYLHYFYGESDWYIVEKDMGDGSDDNTQYQAFGYTILNGDTIDAEWGYISIEELKDTNRVELDFYFEPVRFGDLNLSSRRSTYESPFESAIQMVPAEPAPPVETAAVEPAEVIKSGQSLLETYKNRPQSEINNAIRELLYRGTDREMYSADEIAFMELYEGAGGLMREGEKGARLFDQFFTPLDICAKMWGLALKYGFNFDGARIMEPAFGSGRFFKFIPPDADVHVSGYDIDDTCYRLCRVLYPKFSLRMASFESLFFNGKRHVGLAGLTEQYDLVIGNPPYREYISEYAPLGEKEASGASTFEMYFIMRGVDILKPKGLLVYLIPNTFLSNDNKYNAFKDKLNAKAELIDAYRLPNNVFHNTGVGTDIIVLQKR